MIIYLVCNTVDLGYHAEYAYTTLERAEAKMAELIEAAKQQFIESAMTSTAYCAGKTYEVAAEDAEQYHEKWEIAQVEVEE
jgi:hypothetical protein